MASIVSNIKAGKVASLEIQYDRNLKLAQSLVQEIGAQSSMQALLSQSSPPDSPTVSYERNRVIAIVRTK